MLYFPSNLYFYPSLCNPSKTPDPFRRVKVSKGSNFSTPTPTPHQPLAQGSGVFKPLLFTKYNSASSCIWTRWWPFCGLCIWWCGSSFFIRHSGVSHFFSLFLIFKRVSNPYLIKIYLILQWMRKTLIWIQLLFH